MKKMNKLTVAAIALAALAFASTAASAQVAPGAADLVLGFQVPGNNSDLEVDLGSSDNFTPTTAKETLSQLSVADLVAVFGSSWSTTVNWSVNGINSNMDGSSFYATSINPASSVRTSSSSNLTGVWGNISSLAGGSAGAGSLKDSPATANSASSAIIGGTVTSVNTGGLPASGLPQSYTSLEGGSTGFGFVNNEEATGAGTDELFSFVAGDKVGGKYPLAGDVGTFSLSSTGAFTFTGINASTQSVPEPSAYALGICAALLFIVLRRRHTVA